MNRTNNIFEIVTVNEVDENPDGATKLVVVIHETDGEEDNNLRLKGKFKTE